MQRYKKVEIIGEGGFGEVYKCRDVQTNAIVAVKWIPFDHDYGGLSRIVLREISALKELNHDNIVRLLDVVDGEGGIHLVFEYMKNDLCKLIYAPSRSRLNPLVNIKDFLHQILQGVSYCHSQKFLHRDLKPANLLVDSDCKTVKLADFGYSRTFDVPLPQYTTTVTTLPYKAPELLLEVPYSTAVDIWAVGCIFAEMVIKDRIFDGTVDTAVMKNIIRILGFPDESEWRGVTNSLFKLFESNTLPSITPTRDLESVVAGHLDEEGFDLLSKMLCIYPNRRITAYEALRHPYFEYYDTYRYPYFAAPRGIPDLHPTI